MKIQWEIGDKARVEDNVEAGPLAAAEVEIIGIKMDPNYVVIKGINIMDDYTYDKTDTIHIQWLHPIH